MPPYWWRFKLSPGARLVISEHPINLSLCGLPDVNAVSRTAPGKEAAGAPSPWSPPPPQQGQRGPQKLRQLGTWQGRRPCSAGHAQIPAAMIHPVLTGPANCSTCSAGQSIRANGLQPHIYEMKEQFQPSHWAHSSPSSGQEPSWKLKNPTGLSWTHDFPT